MLHSLSHPNVVRLLGVNKTDMPCLVMELLNGGSLFDLLHGVPEGTPPLPLNWSLSFLKDVAEAIEYLHSLPMAHRDLKSQNIMMRVIGGDGNVEPVLIGAWSGLGGVCYGFFCPSIIDHPFQKAFTMLRFFLSFLSFFSFSVLFLSRLFSQISPDAQILDWPRQSAARAAIDRRRRRAVRRGRCDGCRMSS